MFVSILDNQKQLSRKQAFHHSSYSSFFSRTHLIDLSIDIRQGKGKKERKIHIENQRNDRQVL